MLDTIRHSVLVGNTFQGVQVTFVGSEVRYDVILVQKKKEAITIQEQYVCNDFDELASKLRKNLPIILSFGGQGIITKKVANAPNYQSKLLFNASLDDFYWYELRYEATIFASVVRKSVIDQELNKFEQQQLSIIDLSIGPGILATIKPLLSDTTTVNSQEQILIFEGEQLERIEKTTEVSDVLYTLGDEQITSSQLASFATIINYVYPNADIVYDNGMVQATKETFSYKRVFNFFGIFVLAFFLVSLLVSFLLLGYYQGKNQELQLELANQNVAYNQLLELEKDKQNKEAILKASGLDDSNSLTYYVKELTKEVPFAMNLEMLKVFPPRKKIKNGQRIDFDNSSIVIGGVVTTNEAFTEWIQQLKKLSWVKNLEIIDFSKESRKHSFKIKITVSIDV